MELDQLPLPGEDLQLVDNLTIVRFQLRIQHFAGHGPGDHAENFRQRTGALLQHRVTGKVMVIVICPHRQDREQDKEASKGRLDQAFTHAFIGISRKLTNH